MKVYDTYGRKLVVYVPEGGPYLPLAGGVLTGPLEITASTGKPLKVDGTTLVVDADNNRVGIGTDTPEQALDVNGDVRMRSHLHVDGEVTVGSDLTVSAGAFISGTADLYQQIRFNDDSTSNLYRPESGRVKTDGTLVVEQDLYVNGLLSFPTLESAPSSSPMGGILVRVNGTNYILQAFQP
jgi:hypothetical protein